MVSPSFAEPVSCKPSLLVHDGSLFSNAPTTTGQVLVKLCSLFINSVNWICQNVTFAINIKSVSLCFIVLVLLLNHGYGGDPRTELLDFLEKATKSTDILSGTLETLKLADTDITKGSLPLKSDESARVARFYKHGEDILLETSGNIELSNVGPGSRFNNIADVIVFSDDQVFEFIPLVSGLDPFANLRVHRPKDAEGLRSRIDDSLIFVLASAYQVNGLSFASYVISPDAQVSGDLQSGLSLHVTFETLSGKNDLKYIVKASDGKFSSYAKVESTVAGAGNVVVEVRCDGLWNGITASPNLVVRRLSGGPFSNPVVEQVKVIVEPWDESIKFPIDKEFFKRYERDYTFHKGVDFAGQNIEVIEAVPGHIRGLGMKRFDTIQNPLRRGYGYTIAAGVLFSLLVILGIFWILKKGRVR